MADFETWESLGSNAYGTVFRGVQFSLKREVAILQLDAALRKEAERSPRFWDEITAVAQLTDDRLVPVYAVDRGQGWIVMELMAGHCGQLLTKPLDAEAARSVLRQGLQGLERLQEQKRTHGDIRPQTLLLNRAGRVKLSFSVGSAVAGGLPYQKRQMKYVAPEAVSPSFGEYGSTADLYSLGFSVLELLVGPKFDALFPGVDGNEQASRTAWMRWHAGDATKLPSVAELAPNAPLELVMVLDRLLKKPVADRYASAADALKDLTQTPLVPIIAPELGITGSASGAALVSDVDRIFNPSSKYDTATAPGSARPAGSASPANTAPGKPGNVAKSGAAKSAADEKKKKNRKALLVGLLFALGVVGVFAMPGGEQAPDEVAEAPKPEPKPTPTPPPEKPKNQPPELKPDGLKGEIPELAAWSLKLEARDAETKPEKLKLTLLDAPAGLTLDTKTNMLTWTPTEQQGPGDVNFRVRLEDDAESPLAQEKTFELAVKEVNAAPTIKSVAAINAKVGAPVAFKLEGADSDVPVQKLSYGVVSDSALPEGAKLDGSTGEFTWTPTSDVTGKTTKFTVAVSDDGKPSLSARTEIVVNVTADNKPPVIEQIADRTINLPLQNTAGPALSFPIESNDPDAAAGAKLKFALVAPVPEGAKLDAATGLFTFAPTVPDDLKMAPVKVTVEATDAGTPPLSTKSTFTVTFRTVDLLALLRAKLEKATTARAITAVVSEGRKLQTVTYVDQKKLRTLLADAYVKRGDAYIADADLGSALVDFNTVVKELEVAHIDARLGRAFCYGRQGDWRTAITEYDDILGLDNDNASALRNRATARYELKQYAEAASDCDKAIAADSSEPTTFFVRANAKLQLKKQADALSDFRQATELFLAQPTPSKAMLIQCVEKQLEIMKADPKLRDPAAVASNERLLKELKTGTPTTAGN
ncbi:MAG: putative Ig domain-containing protein [Pirellulales bacterium]